MKIIEKECVTCDKKETCTTCKIPYTKGCVNFISMRGRSIKRIDRAHERK
jgi:hypothetical protein